MARTITPFLMFDGAAEEAVRFYVSLFAPRAEIRHVDRWRAGESGREGSIKHAEFSIAGQCVIAMDSPAKHDFTFTPAMSLFVECESEAELETVYAALSNGGQLLMPLDHYGFSRRFAWVNDRFGVSWQLNWA